MTKSTKKSSKDFPSLENLPASSRPALCKHLSPSGANIASEPSNYSIVTATGSKRSSADSDSLLCHVRLWQTSRFRFGCASVCEHSEIKFALHNTHVTPHPPLSRSPFCPCLGDADRVRLRESVNSPLEKAGKNPCFRQRVYWIHARPALSAGVQACVHESARLSRVICSHAW